jgi:serine-type D-Ala-D-Ala endopeptidase (penicillin-binding protein 7)
VRILAPMKISSTWFIALAWLLVPALAAGQVPAEGQSRLDPAALELASAQAAVADLASGELLFTKHADRQVPIASVTKLMSAVVVLDSGAPLDEWLTIVPRAERAPVNAYSRIRIGSELRRADLLRITLMASENQAAYVLSRHHPGGREAFVAAMNDKAAELGMHASQFVDASGLSAQNRSTAADLLRLLAAALDYELIRDYTRTTGFTAQFRNPRYTLQYGNTNLLVHRESWDVVLSKTGYLQVAGRCLALVANIDGRPIAMVLLDSLGTRTPLGDAGRIGRWLRTGQGGSVAVAARDYERQRQRDYAGGLNKATTEAPWTAK